MQLTFRKIAAGFVAATAIAALLPLNQASAVTNYTLTIKKAGNGTGTVVSSPSGIDCGSKCSASAPEDTVITLIATPTGGSQFTGWSGSCTGTGSCIVSMTGAVTVTATFVAVPRTLSVLKAGSGSGSVTSRPNGISCTKACVSASAPFNSGTAVTLTASASQGSIFTGWSGACTNTSVTCSVAMTEVKSVTATFILRPYLTVTKLGNGTGTVVSSPSGIRCGQTCGAGFPEGTSVTLTATAAAGSRFIGWIAPSCGGSSPTCTVTVDGPLGVIAQFERVFSLSVTKTGAGTGTVTSSPAGIDCGATCSTNSLSGQTVTLIATPTLGHVFDGWSGGNCTGTGNCVVTLNVARSVTATFKRVPYLLSVATSGAGSGSVISNIVGINCGSLCSSSLLSGATLTLTAVPAAGSAFDGWTGACTNATGTCTVTMTEAKSVTAKFAQGFGLTVSKTGSGSGTVTSSPAGVNCGSTCSYSFVSGTSVTLTAVAAAESSFTGWSGEGCTGTGTCVVSLSQARNVTADFAKVQYTLTASKGGTGEGSVTSSPDGISCNAACDEDEADFDSGTVVTLTAAAVAENVFTGWSGSCSNSSGACTVSMNAAKSITANFKPLHLLTVSKPGDGTGTVVSDVGGVTCGATCTSKFVEGTSVTLTASPESGTIFKGWSGACTNSSGSCEVTMSEAKTVTADFEKVNQTVGIELIGAGTGFVTSSPAGITCGADCEEDFLSGSTVTLTATSVPGSSFAGWSGDGCSGLVTTCTLTLDSASSVSGPKSVTARFEPFYLLTVNKSGYGSVSSSPAGINCGSTCSASFGGGSEVTLTASPSGGHMLKEWGGACSGSSSTCTVTMSAATVVTATFVPVVTLTISRSGSTGTGAVTSSPSGINCGTACWKNFATDAVVTLTAVPAPGSKFSGWDGGGCSGTALTCVVTMDITKNVNAVFVPI